MQICHCAGQPDALLARVLGGAILVALLLWFVANSRETPRLPGPDPSDRETERKSLAPAVAALVVLCALLAAFFLARFYAEFCSAHLSFLNDRAVASKSPLEIAARGVWAMTLFAVIVTSAAVCWYAARIWRWTPPPRQELLSMYLAMTVFAIAVVSLLGWSGHLKAFGSMVSFAMLDSIWTRNRLQYLGPVTDGLNAVALIVSSILAGAFCLLLRATHAAGRLLADAGAGAVEAAQKSARLIQTLMDRLLYIGAAALMAGLLEVVATLVWSYAPFPDTADLKKSAELCKAVVPAPPAAAASALGAAPPLPAIAGCADLAGQVEQATKVDDLKRFTRLLAVVFGASFSALLAAMYLPVALAHERLVESLLPHVRQQQADSPPAEQPGDLERGTTQRVFNVLAALAPLAAAILSSVFGV